MQPLRQQHALIGTPARLLARKLTNRHTGLAGAVAGFPSTAASRPVRLKKQIQITFLTRFS